MISLQDGSIARERCRLGVFAGGGLQGGAGGGGGGDGRRTSLGKAAGADAARRARRARRGRQRARGQASSCAPLRGRLVRAARDPGSFSLLHSSFKRVARARRALSSSLSLPLSLSFSRMMKRHDRSCRKFSPKLLKYYELATRRPRRLEIIWVSGSRDQRAYDAYRAEMSWPSVPFDPRRARPAPASFATRTNAVRKQARWARDLSLPPPSRAPALCDQPRSVALLSNKNRGTETPTGLLFKPRALTHSNTQAPRRCSRPSASARSQRWSSSTPTPTSSPKPVSSRSAPTRTPSAYPIVRRSRTSHAPCAR